MPVMCQKYTKYYWHASWRNQYKGIFAFFFKLTAETGFKIIEKGRILFNYFLLKWLNV